MKFEWSEDSGSDTLSVHRAIPEGIKINKDAQITFGVELEFLVPYIIKGRRDPHPNDPRPPVEVDESEAGFRSGPPDKVLKQIRSHIEAAFVGEEQSHMASDVLMMGYRDMKNKEHRKWDLKEDHSLAENAFTDEDEYEGWVSVEIASRIFYSHTSRDMARNDNIMRMIVRGIRWKIRCRVNNTCGLHVHVGLEDTLPQQLHGLKKLATVLWIAEDLLEKLYHPARREENRPLNFYCRPLRTCSMLGKSTSYDKNHPNDDFYEKYLRNIFEKHGPLASKMAKLWEAKTTERLVQLLRGAPGQLERLSYNFDNLTGGSGTLEFRAMESTMNEEMLKHWSYLCQQLLRIAKRHPEADLGAKNESERYQDLIQALVERPKGFDTWKFLKLIYVDDPTIEFFKKKHEWDAESWEQLKPLGSPRDLESYTWPYRPAAPFFATQLMTEYGLNR